MEESISEGEITFDGQPKATESTGREVSKVFDKNDTIFIDLEELLNSGDEDANWVYFGVGGPA